LTVDSFMISNIVLYLRKKANV